MNNDFINQDIQDIIIERDGYKEQVEEKDKEIDRLNNIISELEKSIQKEIDRTNDLILEDSSMVEINNIRRMLNDDRQCWLFELNKLKELKEKENE